jgi:large subunit ribosomal protein L22
MEAIAKLKNHPTSPRRMRLLADAVRGMGVEKALALLEHHPQHAASPLYKLLKSAINNWEQKNEGKSAADEGLIVKTIFVDGARTLKRMLPAPQGRAYRIRKRSNHVTLIVDTRQSENLVEEPEAAEEIVNVEQQPKTTRKKPAKKVARKASKAAVKKPKKIAKKSGKKKK